MSPITPVTLVPVILWLSRWPIEPPTESQAATLAVLVYALIQDIKAWIEYRKGMPPQ